MTDKQYGVHGEFRDLLCSKGIKPSYQRLLILEYIMKNKNHPSAETIFKNISRSIPTLSRTTVYNNVNIFVRKGILSSIKTNKSETRYDIIELPHAHLYCHQCNQIIDVDLKIPLYHKKSIQGHKIEEVQVQFRGTCRNCLKNKEKKTKNVL